MHDKEATPLILLYPCTNSTFSQHTTWKLFPRFLIACVTTDSAATLAMDAFSSGVNLRRRIDPVSCTLQGPHFAIAGQLFDLMKDDGTLADKGPLGLGRYLALQVNSRLDP